ncbi:MAG: Holliday junction branch migration protein RuvA [Caldilineaceae bacterium]|nr:Holliday junction branch migration protein RuvA [Caldilineaceae bacterium]MBP8107552.1 Holliday junction branch migration protein RuvA [Caldilineaceae bacterium]MBP8122470.1 Holliday junction branch migration protein RuvA [Caldilineaceae bacterium]
MIRLIRGVVMGRGKNYLILDVGSGLGGIGFKVFAPEPTLVRFRPEEKVTLHTYLQVREDDLSLYGFESDDELTLFELLLGVSGVGPKVALSALSSLAPDALRLAIGNREPALLARVPGIGKRTAEKIVLDLRDKVGVPTSELVGLAQSMEMDSDVIEALIALGYSVVEAQRAVQALPKEVVGIEDRLRLALSQFDR